MSLIDPGSKAPAWSLLDKDARPHVLKDYSGAFVVLYFYPKDDTSVCTNQACTFRDLLPRFRRANAAILGISPDSSESHAAFAKKHKLNFTLLADPPGPTKTPKVCSAYGTWAEKSMYGRKYMGVVRTTYLIDPEGIVVRRWDRVRVTGHADQVLEAIREASAARK
jgi:peroxiredoxin Q/BCP